MRHATRDSPAVLDSARYRVFSPFLHPSARRVVSACSFALDPQLRNRFTSTDKLNSGETMFDESKCSRSQSRAVSGDERSVPFAKRRNESRSRCHAHFAGARLSSSRARDGFMVEFLARWKAVLAGALTGTLAFDFLTSRVVAKAEFLDDGT
ncbi:MAG: hypothetical protein ACYC7A_21890 [Thermoanaerobaculia bacterium]